MNNFLDDLGQPKAETVEALFEILKESNYSEEEKCYKKLYGNLIECVEHYSILNIRRWLGYKFGKFPIEFKYTDWWRLK